MCSTLEQIIVEIHKQLVNIVRIKKKTHKNHYRYDEYSSTCNVIVEK